MKTQPRQLAAAVILALAVVGVSHAQEQAKKSQATEQRATAGASKQSKPALSDVTRVSTEDAARFAAQAEPSSKQQATRSASQRVNTDVLELQPAPAARSVQARDDVTSKPKAKKPVLNDLHGSAYGSLGATNSGSRSGGAEAGASSRSGKAHVYVQAESSRTERPK